MNSDLSKIVEEGVEIALLAGFTEAEVELAVIDVLEVSGQ